MKEAEHMKNNRTKNLIISALLLALGMVLPFLTFQLKEIGDSLLPMHIPVMLTGLVCGPLYGGAVGLVMPVFRSVCFGMPPLYPNSVWMSLELATYGIIIGLLYKHSKKKNTTAVIFSLAASMVCGRLVWGFAKYLLLSFNGKPFALQAFWAGGFIDALPGIVLQFVLIPFIINIINRHRKNGEGENVNNDSN